jgi:ADP-heptose:LPS heptosyltransferase
MGLKRNLLELGVGMVAKSCQPFQKTPSDPWKEIFVLRNNSFGDLLCTTPLLKVLKENFPETKISLGIGTWHQDIMDGNPHIDEVIRINAPWHNQFAIPKNYFSPFWYIWSSPEVKALKKRQIDCGIDVLGSPFGSLLLLRSGIPMRLGVKGYAGGHTGVQRYIDFSWQVHATNASLKMAALLDLEGYETWSRKPEIYLRHEELEKAKGVWTSGKKRIVVAPGGSFHEKCWPIENYLQLLKNITVKGNVQLVVLGGKEEFEHGEKIQGNTEYSLNLAGKTSLRESFAIVSSADLLLSNSSVLMHAAAAFDVPNLVLLGGWYDSADLHYRQWGHPHTIVMGKELSDQKYAIATAGEAFQCLQEKQWL